jgi:hypothetical protein
MKKINMAEMFTDDEVVRSAESVLKGGHYINGNENKEFEKEFAKFCETDYSVTVNSGTNALILALASLRVGPGDEVIMPSHTFIATANAAMFSGAKPVFAEIDENNYTLDPESTASLITENTKVIIPGPWCRIQRQKGRFTRRYRCIQFFPFQKHDCRRRRRRPYNRFRGNIQLCSCNKKSGQKTWGEVPSLLPGNEPEAE